MGDRSGGLPGRFVFFIPGLFGDYKNKLAEISNTLVNLPCLLLND